MEERCAGVSEWRGAVEGGGWIGSSEGRWVDEDGEQWRKVSGR